VPTYNYAEFIGECIESVFRQTFHDFEILVIDDGSTDHTQKVLKAFDDSRLRLVMTHNRGVSAARNTGLDLAQGKFIAFLDADDRWLPHKLEVQVAALLANPEVGFIFTNFIRFDSDGNYFSDQFSFAPEINSLLCSRISGTEAYVIDEESLSSLLRLQDMPWYPTVNMVEASLAKKERFSEHRRVAEDLDYFLRIWIKTRSAFIPEICAELRRHGRNASATLQFNHHENVIDVLKNLENFKLTYLQTAGIQRRKGLEWASLGYGQWRSGLYIPAGISYAQAMRYPGKRLNSLKHLVALPFAILYKSYNFLFRKFWFFRL
jgi:glycosyltransferase involved in cell wall biosynthesis